MGRSKVFLLDEIKRMGGQMMATMIEEDVAIKPEQLDLGNEADQLPMTMVREGHKWIEDVFATEYAEVVRIKNLQPDEMWTRYKKWGGFEEHREVILLHDALVALRKRVISRGRPDIFKSSKRTKAIKAWIKAKASRSKSRRTRAQTR